MATTESQLFESRDLYAAWDDQYYDPRAVGFYDAAMRRIAERLGLRPGDEVLDMGCGPGPHTLRLARMGFRVVAADISETALARTLQVVEHEGLQNQVVTEQRDITKLDYPDGRFGYILCWGVLMHVPQIDRAVAELARVLQPGGRLALGISNGASLDAAVVAAARALIGRRVPAELTDFGRCRRYDTPTGSLLVRDIHVPNLIRFAESHGLSSVARYGGQLTELHSRVRAPWARAIMGRLNALWSEHVRWAGPAQNNILILEKNRRQPADGNGQVKHRG
jgi:2-polyprenyl-3-methyl-5-hydroxy-6-metoxy-1,4-benzoquinol methylase